MAYPLAVFFDVGGVCLTNGWDHAGRSAAARLFSLDYDELERRHDALYAEFERGELDLASYLDHTVFYRDRAFSRDDFEAFMRGRSKPHPAMLDLVAGLHDAGTVRLATLNNESRELNEYRIDRFGLDTLFEAFFSSCYLGVRKPAERIFHMALDIVGLDPDRVAFVDDREENVFVARQVGLRAVLADDAGAVARGLRDVGVEWPGADDVDDEAKEGS
ncbi:MAG: HAD family phosphatase [Candidatus Palauibacterales bacterium]|nr:HAD family phosphatase [Candidatus Palauibacterales bacterium]MDP2529807.1 HAD family phosphatase [Candidatus Palauibacterales bacterium]MDP2582866.1 HAD family phosphatase [Candidatus Palauibacterales bacterium]